MRRPVMIEGCQHGFCLGCLTLKFEGKSNFECPYCQNDFVPSQVLPCKVRWTLVDTLRLKCDCGEKFPSQENLDIHRLSCVAIKEGHSMTVQDLLQLDLRETPIPSSVERATLKVLQHKIDTSTDGTAEFASGGPRVSSPHLMSTFKLFYIQLQFCYFNFDNSASFSLESSHQHQKLISPLMNAAAAH